MKNKLIFAFFVSFSLFVSGCQAKKSVGAKSVSKKSDLSKNAAFENQIAVAKKSAAEAKSKISFSWWGKAERHEYTLLGLEAFKKQHPQISVVPSYDQWSGYEEKFDQLYKQNATADVMQINFDWLYKYSADGNGFYDLQQLEDILELSNFTLAELENGKMNGKLNALPTAFNAIIPVYDQTAFEKYGLSVPNTWDELFYAAKVMKNDGGYALGISQKSLFLLTIAYFEQTYGKSVFTNNAAYNLTKEETGQMLQFVKKLFDEKVIFPQINTFKADDIIKYKLSGVVCWCSESSKYADVIENRGGNAVLGEFISTPGAVNSGWYLKPATMYAIKKDCQNPQAAAELVNFLLNSSEMALFQKCEKGVPVSNKAITTLMENNCLAQMEFQSLMKIRFNNTNINKMLPPMENKDILESFYKNSLAFIEDKACLEECSSAFYDDVQAVIQHQPF